MNLQRFDIIDGRNMDIVWTQKGHNLDINININWSLGTENKTQICNNQDKHIRNGKPDDQGLTHEACNAIKFIGKNIHGKEKSRWLLNWDLHAGGRP
jgi:hypothetical protein